MSEAQKETPKLPRLYPLQKDLYRAFCTIIRVVGDPSSSPTQLRQGSVYWKELAVLLDKVRQRIQPEKPSTSSMEQDLREAQRLILKQCHMMSDEEWKSREPLIRDIRWALHHFAMHDPAWVNTDRTHENEQ